MKTCQGVAEAFPQHWPFQMPSLIYVVRLSLSLSLNLVFSEIDTFCFRSLNEIETDSLVVAIPSFWSSAYALSLYLYHNCSYCIRATLEIGTFALRKKIFVAKRDGMACLRYQPHC